MKRRSDPAWLGFLLQLSLDTHVREDEFGEWLLQNLPDLRTRFHGSGEPDSTQVEWTFGIWARREFLAREVTA